MLINPPARHRKACYRPHMPSALITGASTGIGRDLALLCARAGYDVVAVARSQNQLESLAGQIRQETKKKCHPCVADLTEPSAPERVASSLDGSVPDILINNAGIGLRGFFHELDTAKQMHMLQLNVNALTLLTRLVLPGMIARRAGRIMNVASTAAFQPGPLMAVYYASKAYVLSFSEALHNEVKTFGVTVTTLCPGPTAPSSATEPRWAEPGCSTVPGS